MLILGLLALAVFASVVGRIADWNARRFPADSDEVEAVPSPASRAWSVARTRRAPAAPSLPEGHRPPTGLGPLSPSERFLQTEASRGLRELQLFLLEQKTP
ncbi:MAG: hypothetical protein JWO60_1316 [Frankiales bacterium]|nr:hypothetical protein [Frankiales bacterium]